MGQAPVIPIMPKLYDMIIDEKIDPTEIITHKIPLEEAAHGYHIFNGHEDNCIKVVLKP